MDSLVDLGLQIAAGGFLTSNHHTLNYNNHVFNWTANFRMESTLIWLKSGDTPTIGRPWQIFIAISNH